MNTIDLHQDFWGVADYPIAQPLNPRLYAARFSMAHRTLDAAAMAGGIKYHGSHSERKAEPLLGLEPGTCLDVEVSRGLAVTSARRFPPACAPLKGNGSVPGP